MSSLWVPALGVAVVHALWQGVLVAAAVEGIVRVVGGAAARARHAVAVAGLLLLAAGFGGTVLLVVEGVRGTMVAGAVGGASAAAGPSPGVLRGLGQLWLVATFAGLARLVAGLLAVRRVVRGASAVRDRRLYRALREARRRVGGPRRVALLESDVLDSPVAVGWRRPALILPGGFAGALAPEHVVAILAHELVHVRRQDFARGVLLRALGAVLSLQPAAVLLGRRIAAAREELCDDVVAETCGALVYARALERLERARPGRARLRLAHAASPTAARILRVLRPAPCRTRQAAVAGLVAALVLLGAAVTATPRVTGWGDELARRTLPLVTIRAVDGAGAFTLAMRSGRAVAATIEGVAVPGERLVQSGDSIRILEADGAAHVTVRVADGGAGISWAARARRR